VLDMTKMPDIEDLTHEQKDALIIDLVRRLNELEGKLEKDSHNSSKPPSSDGLKRKPKSLRGASGARPGAQLGHPGKTLKRVAQADHVEIHRVAAVCDACGHAIGRDRVSVLPEERQVIDLPAICFEVTAHRIETAQCRCGKIHHATFPRDVSQAVQYGCQIKAAAVYLTQYQQLPIDRARQALSDLFGLSVSAGTVQNCIDEAARNLKPAVQQINQALQGAPVVHFDETSMRVGRSTHWLHTASTGTLSWYGSHTRRGQEALDSFGILPSFAGVAVHDGWVPYANYECEHALCNAHHLRELIFVWESTQQRWAERMIRLLRDAKIEVERSIADGKTALSAARKNHYRRRSRALIAEGRTPTRNRRASPREQTCVAGSSKALPIIYWDVWSATRPRCGVSWRTIACRSTTTRPNAIFACRNSSKRYRDAFAPHSGFRRFAPSDRTWLPYANNAVRLLMLSLGASPVMCLRP